MWKVEVVEAATGKVVKTLHASSERKADKLSAGLDVNLGHENYFTRVVLGDAENKEDD